jgi:hypothetical protein
MARILAEAGYPADFDVSSLGSPDDLIRNSWIDGRPTPGGFFAPPHLGPGWSPDLQAGQLAIYLGETLRRRHGGQWRVARPGEREAFLPVLQLPNGLSTNPFVAVGHCMGGGPSLSEYASSVAALAEGRMLDGNPAHCCPESRRPTRPEKVRPIDVMQVIESFAGSAANWLTERGYLADYSPASLAGLDKFITENAPDWGPMWEGDFKPEDIPHYLPVLRRVVALGCYIGEVLRQQHGGEVVLAQAQRARRSAVVAAGVSEQFVRLYGLGRGHAAAVRVVGCVLRPLRRRLRRGPSN